MDGWDLDKKDLLSLIQVFRREDQGTPGLYYKDVYCQGGGHHV